MSVKFNKKLDNDLDYYDSPVERRYCDYLIETGNAIVIDNLIVDVPAIVERRFVCHTDLCVGKNPPSYIRGRSCCSSFDVRVSPGEAERIEKLVKPLTKYSAAFSAELKSQGGQWWHYDELDYNKTLNVANNGGCIFLLPREDGFHKCGLHAVALEKGIDPRRNKPSACIMFPLFMIEIDDDYLLTCTSRETAAVLEEDPDNCSFGCLKKNRKATRPLYEEMGDVITYMFGAKTYDKICKEVRKRNLG